MRINRTFSIDYNLVLELKKKPNQSEIVNKAVWKYLDPNQPISLDDAETSTILTELSLRFEPNTTEMELLKTLKSVLS